MNNLNPQAVMQQIQNLKNVFHGDPNQQIQQMLNNGTVSQQQYNEAVQKAQQIMRMLGAR